MLSFVLLGPILYDVGSSNSLLKALIHLFILGYNVWPGSILGHWKKDLIPQNKNTPGVPVMAQW